MEQEINNQVKNNPTSHWHSLKWYFDLTLPFSQILLKSCYFWKNPKMPLSRTSFVGF